ncbi:hypothetical protein VKT23_003033 [Stygiomarasmius scandens]|uniref:BTB domain-containing protein n=1 Tax=Marasmiellus scandens TaxID=2682957 RepID=A0ABR1K1P7_9AGAR
MNSPTTTPTAFDLQSHLYSSFLTRSTADVALKVSGTWSAVYRLHRVVLIQAGFFRALFTAGFSETSRPYEINVELDDVNITRAAFELCIARLYGGGPALYIHPTLIPTPNSPLTPGFPFPHVNILSFNAPAGQQPATPHFLMSLLATSLYFSIPSLASQALSLILSTIGPYTIMHYLNFALGKHVQRENILDSAVGLEDVAEILTEDDVEFESDFDDASESVQKEAVSPSQIPRTFHYGAISDKIGEACATWLSRWGADMFVHEEHEALKSLDHQSSSTSSASISVTRSTSASSRPRAQTLPSSVNSSEGSTIRKRVIPSIWIGDGLSPSWIRALISSDFFFIDDERARYEFATRVVEIRRRMKKLEGEHVYGKGKAPVNDDVPADLDDTEEAEWRNLFETGLYYANMTPDVFLKLSNDISPTTGKPYAPLAILQAASWDHLLLRHMITERQSSPTSSPTSSLSPSSPTPSSPKGDLGIAVNGADLISSSSKCADETSKAYFLIAADESLRIGDTINVSGIGIAEGSIHNNISMDQLFANSHAATRPTKGDRVSVTENGPTTPDSRTFFGLVGDSLMISSRGVKIRGAVNDDVRLAPSAMERLSKRMYSPYPPYRFSVEFWDLESLKDKQRLHSKTIWYAGSLFNIYVQIIRKKDKPSVGTAGTMHHQLGIYLHRQSTVESIPPRSAPNPKTKKQEEEGRGALCLDGMLNVQEPNGGVSQIKPGYSHSPSLPPLSTSTFAPAPLRYSASDLRPSTPQTSIPRNLVGSLPSRPATSNSVTPSPSSGLLSSQLSSSLPSPSSGLLPSLGRSQNSSLSRAYNLSSSVSSSVPQFSGTDILPNTVPSPSPSSQPYRDPRTIVSVYFSVLCSSPTGNAQTQFRSGPDVFKVSQSWGWKSGGLLGIKADDRGSISGGENVDTPGREVSLRATVVLGIV